MSAKPVAWIASMKFSGGQDFAFTQKEKIVLVGPNNSGKTQSLREILAICQNPMPSRTVVIKEMKIKKSGTVDELRAFLDKNAELVEGNYRFRDWQIPQQHVQFWGMDGLVHGIADGFMKNVTADDRLSICNQQKSISPGDQKSKPQHVLYDNEAEMSRIGKLFRRAFGKDLMFDYRGGSKLPIHVGAIPIASEGSDRVSDAYVKEVRKNPLLDKQGDGMKSYAGILFEAVVANSDITLVDEPEAFLHPPQMRRLGETLAGEVNGQLVIATHSSDILRGFLEGTRGNVRILRIRREAGVNVVMEAPPEAIRELWTKPELRYSNALEGVFHDQTIICEDDSDCRLINAVADHLASESSEIWKDTAYVPTGGKGGVAKVASVLRQIGVPVKAVFDFDFLSDERLVKSVVESFGGAWGEIQPLWRRVDLAVRKGVRPKTISEIKASIVEILAKAGEADLPKSDVIEALKQGKPWSIAKDHGVDGIPRGKVRKDYANLKDKLEEIGIYLIPVGEIEGFCQEIGSHGPEFVAKFLSEKSLSSEDLSLLRQFVEHVHMGPHCWSKNESLPDGTDRAQLKAKGDAKERPE